MSATPRLGRALALVIPTIVTLAASEAGCARSRREGAWVDTTPNGFVAAPVDAPTDAGLLDAASRDSSTPIPPR